MLQLGCSARSHTRFLSEAVFVLEVEHQGLLVFFGFASLASCLGSHAGQIFNFFSSDLQVERSSRTVEQHSMFLCSTLKCDIGPQTVS